MHFLIELLEPHFRLIAASEEEKRWKFVQLQRILDRPDEESRELQERRR